MMMSKAMAGVLAFTLSMGFFTPALAQNQPPPEVESRRPVLPVRGSWTSDQHQVAVGDLVTILVDEYTLASANRTEKASREKGRDLRLAAGGTGSMSGGGLSSENDVSDRTLGESSRSQRFSAEVSARVMEITSSGMVRLEGRRKLQIDDVEQEVTLRGWLRVQDLSTDNTVESWRIADAEILYTSNGNLGKAGGFWSKLLDFIWP